MIEDSRHSKTVKVARRVDTCTHSKELSYKTLLLSVRTRIDNRMYLQMHLFGVMFHSAPVLLGEEWGGPSEIKVIFTGINSTGVLEIRAEDACQSLTGAIFF